MKKVLAILAAAIIILSLGGCSAVDTDFYKTIKGMAGLEDYSFEGTTTLAINKLELLNPTDDAASEIQEVKKALSGSSLSYDGVVNTTNNTLKFHLSMKKADGTTQEVINLYAEDHFIYLLKEPLETLLGNVIDNNPKIHLNVTKINNQEYFVIDMQDAVKAMFDNIELVMVPDGSGEHFTDGYKDGSESALLDIKASNKNGWQVYPPDALGKLTDDADKADYMAGYDAGYADETQNAPVITKLEGYRKPMLDKANTAYLINTFKDIGFKCLDEVVAKGCDKLELGLIQKTGDSQYTLHLADSNIKAVTKSITDYATKNPDMIAYSIKAFLTSLSDEELIFIGINPDNRKQTIDDIDTIIDAILKQHDNSDVHEGLLASDAGADESLPLPTFSCDGNLKKTGSVSYAADGKVSVVFSGDAFNLDITLSSSETINKQSVGEVQAQPIVVNNTAGGSSIRLNVADPNAVGCGVIYSTTSSFDNFLKLAGAKQSDGSYLVTFPALSGSMYYYKAYTVDSSDNLVYSVKVQNFTVAPIVKPNPTSTSTSTSSPSTGDSTSFALLLLPIGCAACCAVLRKRQRSHK